MRADPTQVMRILDFRNVDVWLEDGRLIGRCRDGPMPEDMVQFIQHFKELIIIEVKH